ncbi:ABC transporter ATP-binding protein [Paeniglutamicibacter sp. MACA_103]|uniref:ABC transporter ATP-binding protein n=1 Tax=Paeniglutamicibacter sp. MACA_103 TaxID=3377337 RepID=UPI0038944499
MSTHEPDILVECHQVGQEFAARGGNAVRALDSVNLQIRRGETLGVVGESGCGKSTLARAIMLLRSPSSGHVEFDGRRMDGVRGRELKRQRQRMQMVFQDPNDSLDPTYTVARSIMEPLLASGSSMAEARLGAQAAITEVGMTQEVLARHPHEFSGGQRQRIAIARALATHPEFMVLDEPTSALDVSIQAQILNLLARLQRERNLTYLFISHNLGVVRHLSDRVAVMYLGRVVEVGDTEEVFSNPRHPYTKALLSAVPDPEDTTTERIVLSGDLPSPRKRYTGCAFASRCWLATDICRAERPELAVSADGAPTHRSACHHPELVSRPFEALSFS